jgi:hypothetical protein
MQRAGDAPKSSMAGVLLMIDMATSTIVKVEPLKEADVTTNFEIQSQ